MKKYKHHIFVCTSSRINGTQKGFCCAKGSAKLTQRFLEEIEDRGLEDEVAVTNTGCFGLCQKGPIVVVYPEGVWYGGVSEDDARTIMDEHIVSGKVVERLLI